MLSKLLVITGFLSAHILYSQSASLDLRTENETIPPGQVVQIKTALTEPKPISGGKGVVSLSSRLTALRGIAGFDSAGTLSGVATLNNGALRVRCLSPTGDWGTDDDYPLFVVAANVDPNTPIGTNIPLTLNQNSSWWLDPQGKRYSEEVHSGVLTVGGTLSVSDVVPGGGMLPAGSVVQVLGSGFDATTEIQVHEVNTSSSRLISSSEIDFTLAQPADLTGKRVRVKNKAGEEVEYYSYLRSTLDASSSIPAVAAVTPIFPARSYSSASFVLAPSAQYFTAFALQNPTAASVTAKISLYSFSGALLADAVLKVEARHSAVREASEIAGSLTGAAYFRIAAPVPIQMMAFKVDQSTSAPSPLPAKSAH